MQTLASSGGYTQVYAAPHTGLYQIVLVGPGSLKHNSDSLSLHASDNDQQRAAVYMAAGDTLSYSGAGASLAGAILGDVF